MADEGPKAAGAGSREAADWFFQTSQEGFALAKDGQIVCVNPAWCAIARSRALNEVGRFVEDLFVPEEEEFEEGALTRLARTGVGFGEHRLVRSSGDPVWVRASFKQGLHGYLIIIIHDISQKRAASRESEAQERAMELLRSEAGVSVWRYDPISERISGEVDAAFSAKAGEGRQAGFNPMSLAPSVDPEDLPDLTERFLQAIATGRSGEAMFRHTRQDGSKAHVRASWRGVREAAPGRWELQGISQDVTALAEARDAALMGELAAKEAADVKSRFLRTMSHEVRTPLNGVLGALHILRTSAQAEEDGKLIDHALNCGAILAKLLDDVVDLSALEAQQVELFAEPVNPEEILRGVCDLFRPQAEAKGLAFSVEATPLKKSVRLDGGRLRQILFNLIANAVKFTVSGSVSIRQTSRLTGDDHRIRIEVEDTGVGVASGAEAFIFEGFSQADGSFTRSFGGAGLGLAISRRLATLMGGEIGVRSQEDHGSTFWVELPAPVVCAASAPEAASEDALLGMSILVVDDNATNRVIARTLLEILGAEVDTAEDGAQAVLAARQRAYDVIFMDIQMPILDGVEATRRIKRNEGANQSTPIVAMTANTLPEQLRAYREAGMAGCLAKPLSPVGILGAVRDAKGGGADLAATG